MSDGKYCCADVHDSYGVGFHSCSRRGVVEDKGNFYCKQHSPAEVAKRDAASKEKYAKQREKDRAMWDRRAAITALCEGVDTEVIQCLGQGWLARELGSRID